MLNRFIATMVLVIVLVAGQSSAEDNGCVPADIAVEAWSNAVGHMEQPSGINVTYAVCDPCSCPSNGWSCYEYLAQKERAKLKRAEEAQLLLMRAKRYGICR